MTFLRNTHLVLLFILFSVFSRAQEPNGYYSAAEGKNQGNLKTALYNIIKDHTILEYYSSSTSFRSTDWHPATTDYPNGYFWDMYSNYKRTSWSGMNREHSMPKSWWSTTPETTVAYSDLNILYPSDANANSAKLNYALGEATTSSILVNTTIKVGPNTFPGYNGTVFEPLDEYKGDFARTYMYVVTCYENYAPNWRSTGTLSMLYNNTYPTFNTYAVNLLLKWNSQDPVSEKEIVRNNAVYSLQHNRNPFVDHPELADFIWGTRKVEEWSVNVGPPETETIFNVLPNPVKSVLTAKINHPEQATYNIYSLDGITLQIGNFTSTGTATVDELQDGMYILVVYTGTKRKVAKFIVQH